MKRFLSCIIALVLSVSSVFADIYVVHSCSGAGKDTIVSAVCDIVKGIHMVPRITTRAKRSNERDGIDMIFVSKDKFERMDKRGYIFLKEVIGDNFYGGDRKRVQEILNKKEDVILIGKFGDIGKEFPNVPVHHVGIFITKETQKKRLAERDTETPEQQAGRMARYDTDMAYAKKYVTFEIDNNADLYENGVLIKSALAIRKFVNFVLENRQRAGIADLYTVVLYKK